MKSIIGGEILKVYCPENYKQTREWGIREWTIALVSRHRLRSYHQYQISPQSYRFPAHQLVDLEEKANNLFLSPIGDESDPSRCLAGHAPVRDQSVAEYFFAVNDWEDPKFADWVDRVKLSGLFDLDTKIVTNGAIDPQLTKEVHSELIKLDETPSWQLLESYADEHDGYFVAVDLKASDDSLKRSFEIWLNRVRVATGVQAVGKVFTKEQAHVWVNQYYLPYLDLTFWSKLQGRRISDEVMAEVLYPSHLDLKKDKVRTDFKAKAERIVSKKFVDALRLQLSESLNG